MLNLRGLSLDSESVQQIKESEHWVPLSLNLVS